MHIKTFSTLSVLLFIFGCGLADPLFDSARRGIDSARHGINCQPIDSINKTSIIRRLAVANGCESIRGTTLVAVSDDVETYKVDCSVEAMEFKCSFYSDIICFFTKHDIPFNSTRTSYGYKDEAACWRTN